jgi:regulatory protein
MAVRGRQAGARSGSASQQAPQRSAYDKALALLARREQSRHELRTRLHRDGYAPEEIEAALGALAEAGYQSDQRFGEMLVRSRIRQGYGPARLRAELRTHELGDEDIGELLTAADTDWPAQAAEQLRRRYGSGAPADYREFARRVQFLARRGFDLTTARMAVEAAAAPAEDEISG